MAVCKCGCGQEVQGDFAQGHDARYKSELLQRMRREYSLDAMRELTSNGWLQKPFKFGVEIEFLDPQYPCDPFDRVGFLAEANNLGITIVEPGYTHNVMSVWKLVSDASCGLELVSPPMTSTKESSQQITTLCRLLREHGARVNSQCGLHVHIYAEAMAPKALFRVAQLYHTLQNDIDAVLAPSRRVNHFCKHFEPWHLAYMKEAADAGKRRLKGYGRDADRYFAVNLNAYHRYGTLEFRQHQGTLNATKIEMWARLCAGLMAVASEPMVDVERWQGRLYDAASMPAKQRLYWDARRAELGVNADPEA